MQTRALFICFLTLVQAGPYAKRARPVAKTTMVAASQWWLEKRLLAVQTRVLGASKDVGLVAEETTREAYRLTDEARVRVEELVNGVTQESHRIQPLFPQCANQTELHKTIDDLYRVLEDVLTCTHKVSDAAAGYEVSMTVQLNDARGQVWDVQEAMYYCEEFQDNVDLPTPQADVECLKRLAVEGLQIVNRLPDRIQYVLDGALASRSEAEDRLRDCFSHGISEAAEVHLSYTQSARQCGEFQQPGK